VALALLVAACAPIRPLPPSADHGPVVSLPLSLSGVTDARRAFAAVFEQELQAAGQSATLSTWLHGPAPAIDSRVQGLSARFAAQASGISVLIVPGLFDDCFESQSVPFGDGRVRPRESSSTEAYRQYDDLGLAGLRNLSLPGRSSSDSNGLLIAKALAAEAARPEVRRIVIVAYSKGLPDTLRALARLQAGEGIPAQLTDLVAVAAPVMGTPMADHGERIFAALSPQVRPFDCSPSDGRELASMTRRESIAWLEAHPLPRDIRYHSIVAYAARRDIGPALRPFHAFLSTFDGRNDGQILASDAVLPAGSLLAEVRADHWDVALPRDRDPNPLMRALTSGRGFPREALLRATLKWVVAAGG
jgi:hypothetical protein